MGGKLEGAAAVAAYKKAKWEERLARKEARAAGGQPLWLRQSAAIGDASSLAERVYVVGPYAAVPPPTPPAPAPQPTGAGAEDKRHRKAAKWAERMARKSGGAGAAAPSPVPQQHSSDVGSATKAADLGRE